MSQTPLFRYPGAKPFETEQEHIFHGRRQDTDALYSLIRAEPLVVVYGKSGLGKSSLLNAGIVPKARRNGDFTPLAIRFQAWQSGKTATPAQIARQVIAPQGSEKTFLDTLIADEPTLWHDLKEAQIQGKRLLLVFDQFEELFTYPKEAVLAFKQELSEALFTRLPQRYLNILEEQLAAGTCALSEAEINLLSESPDMRVVMAIRSDRAHLLNELNDYLPTIQRHTFEVAPLSLEGAQEAILLPARDPNPLFTKPVFDYDGAAVRKIIAFLTKDGQERIESTHLQIVCQSVEDKIVQKGQLVTADSLGNLTTVVTNFYYNTLAKIPDADQRQSAARFIEDELIFDKGNGEGDRMDRYEGIAVQKYKLTESTLRLLVNEHLLREEPRLQGEGYTLELSHDTLVAPVLKAKVQYYEQERLRQEAAENARREAELAEAKRQADIEKRRSRTATLLSIASVIGLLVAVWFYFDADKAKKEALLQKDIAEKSKTEADSLGRVAIAEADKALQNFKLAEKRAIEAKQNADAATKARQEAEKNLTLANEQKGIATEALKQAEINLQKAKDEEAKALAEQAKTQKALEEAQAANVRVVASYIRDIEQHILKLEYDAALDKCQTALALNVESQKDTLHKRILEIAYWYTETDTVELAIKTLNLIKQTGFTANAPNIHRKLQSEIRNLAPPQYFTFLEERYYPNMIPVEGGANHWRYTYDKDDKVKDSAFIKVNSFSMAETETTVWQYFLYLRAKREKPRDTPTWQYEGNNPMVYVTWYDAVEYCNWVGKQKDKTAVYDINKNNASGNTEEEQAKWIVTPDWQAKGYRLPTEAEWEFAARGGNKTHGFEYSGDSIIKNVAWYSGNSSSRTQDVKHLKANELGLYDMSGNVWEWCNDWYDNYDLKDNQNPRGAKEESSRVVRGGSWFNYFNYCRVSIRYYYFPYVRYDSFGFRCVRYD